MSLEFSYTMGMVTEQCCNCGVVFAMPQALMTALRSKPSQSFYCPNGHSMHYTESEDLRLRKIAESKLKQVQNDYEQLSTIKRKLQNELNATNAKLSKVEKSKCPYCLKSYKYLPAHIERKHPERLNKIKIA